MVIKNRMHLCMYAFSFLFMAFLFLLGQERISKYINGDNLDKIGITKLRQVFGTLPLHEGDQFGAIESFDKESIVGVTSHATSAASPVELVNFYSGQLKINGWVRHGVIRKTSHSEKIMFCKDRISLTVEASPTPRGSRYHIGLIWTKYRMSADYCGEAKSDGGSREIKGR